MSTIRSTRCLLGVALAVSLLGCKKAQPINTVALSGPSAPANVPAAQGQEGDASKGRNVIVQMPFDNAAKLVLLNIGRAYEMAYVPNGKPPRNMEELGVEPRNLKTKRDMQDRDIEVLYGIDYKRLEPAEDYALAWEKTPDNGGGRMVLMADLKTVRFVTSDVFEKMKKANQK
ncbi:MAG: hypothetical protein U0796_01415 [Gemmatales bacterium]